MSSHIFFKIKITLSITGPTIPSFQGDSLIFDKVLISHLESY
jgi:hypothetical protein